MSKISEGLKKYESLKRGEYFEKNQELGEMIWEKEKIPTVADIADFMNGNENNENMNAIFEFLDNKDGFIKMANRTTHSYSQDESTEHVRNVMASNNQEISHAGYFYKLVMAAADDLIIGDIKCNSEGVKYDVSTINEDIYDYRIRFMWVNEFKMYMRMSYNEFLQKVTDAELSSIHVRTPMTCNCHPMSEKRICKRCAGALPQNTNNIGNFSALMVTENATQSALSSMNKGCKENMNDILSLGYSGDYTWEDIKRWANEITDMLQNKNVSARFYEIILISRVRKDLKGNPFVSTLKGSINHSGNLFGAYIFTPSKKNFEKMVRAGEFEDNSLKAQIAMNDCKRR